MHQKPPPRTNTIPEYTPRKLRTVKPARLEANRAGGVWPAVGFVDRLFGGEVHAEAVFPFVCGAGVGVEFGFGGSCGVFG